MSEFTTKIESYFSSGVKLPLFIALHSNDYRALIGDLRHYNKIKTSDFCPGSDKDPDISGLKQAVHDACEDSVLLGLGDYLELRADSAENVLSDFKSLSLRSNVAVLLPDSMRDKLQKMTKADPRFRSRVIIADASRPEDMPLHEVSANQYTANGIREYLIEREKGADVKNIKTERNIKSSGKNILDPNNAFAELERSFPEIKNKILKDYGTAEQWDELLKAASDNTVSQIIEKDEFNPIKYTFIHYARGSDFDSWLYFLYLKLRVSSVTPYLKYVIEKTDSQSELLKNAIDALGDFEVSDKNFKSHYSERKALLKDCDDADMTVFTGHTRLKGADGVSYLTDNTLIERKGIIESISSGGDIDKAAGVYPDLSDYLQDYQFADAAYTEYFRRYKHQKVRNEISPEFVSRVNEFAVSRPYNSMPTRISEFARMSKDKSVLIFLDAFGVEYLGYVKAKCIQLDMRFEVKITRCNLPSGTVYNKDFYDDWDGKKFNIKDLDEIKHHPEKGYDYNNEKLPIYLANEMDVVSEALKRAKQELLRGKESVIISSDHGASRLAVIADDNFVSSKGCKVKSSGRYCEGEYLPTTDRITTEDKFAVIADYSRFEGGRKAAVEVHGGGTLEEVLVPVIALTLADKNQIIKVELQNDVIEISYRKKAELVFSISPDYDNVTVSVNGKEYTAEKLSQNNYKAALDDLKNIGAYTARIFENQNFIDAKDFTIKKQGFAEKDLL